MPNKTINSGRMADSFVEWHLAGGAQPLAVSMNEGVCLAVEVDPHHIERRLVDGQGTVDREDKAEPDTPSSKPYDD